MPQGKDPSATDEEQRTAPPAEHKGVITPPRSEMRAFTRKSRTLSLAMRRKSSLLLAVQAETRTLRETGRVVAAGWNKESPT